ncbi:hypothetical protein ACVIHD_005145 [Bradyrhizobium embrapense]
MALSRRTGALGALPPPAPLPYQERDGWSDPEGGRRSVRIDNVNQPIGISRSGQID